MFDDYVFIFFKVSQSLRIEDIKLDLVGFLKQVHTLVQNIEDCNSNTRNMLISGLGSWHYFIIWTILNVLANIYELSKNLFDLINQSA